MDLQLASFNVCVACRGVRTLRVTVSVYMPLSFWRDDDGLGDLPATGETRRLPCVRAAGAVSSLPAGMLVSALLSSPLLVQAGWMQVIGADVYHRCPTDTSDACWLSSCGDLAQPVLAPGLVHSPMRTFEAMVAFLDREDMEMVNNIAENSRDLRYFRSRQNVSWASALRQLVLGRTWGVLANWLNMPTSAQRLALGGEFDQSVDWGPWLASLRHMSLRGSLNQPALNVVWPKSLLKLSFGPRFNEPITGMTWPNSLLELTLGGRFNQPIIDVVWPISLLRLAFGDSVRPGSLVELNWGGAFNQPISGVVWPVALQRLGFGDLFDRPICDVIWPASLKQLAFGRSFDQPIMAVVWPVSLRRLVVGKYFNQPLTNVAWPSSLQQIHCYYAGNAFEDPYEFEIIALN